MDTRIAETRSSMAGRFFPGGIPRLMCPTLTHYADDGDIDGDRMRSHLSRIAPAARVFLVPGSTGDGWELSDARIARLLGMTLDLVPVIGARILVGALKPTAPEAIAAIQSGIAMARERTGIQDPERALSAAGVAGFTVCAPRGAERTQEQIRSALAAILDLGAPTALYQLPQVTENEISPDSFDSLARSYPNFLLFKDTSGSDRIALSAVDPGGVFMVRGMEGEYRRWYKRTPGGRYDGFLLAASNCFAEGLERVMRLCDEGAQAEAEDLSGRISGAVLSLMGEAASLPFGNAFSNSNRAYDHVFAYGSRARSVDAPLTCSGKRLPAVFLSAAMDLLERHGLMPERGYLEV